MRVIKPTGLSGISTSLKRLLSALEGHTQASTHTHMYTFTQTHAHTVRKKKKTFQGRCREKYRLIGSIMKHMIHYFIPQYQNVMKYLLLKVSSVRVECIFTPK